jgi:hypothetical protein
MKFMRSKYAFPVFMSVLMVYGMETYNAIIRMHTVNFATFLVPVYELILLSLIVYILQSALANPFSKFINKLIWGSDNMNPLYRSFTFPIFILIVMCPLMSLVATLLFKFDIHNFFPIWGHTILCNLPMALFWQLLIVGPGLRKLFSAINAK